MTSCDRCGQVRDASNSVVPVRSLIRQCSEEGSAVTRCSYADLCWPCHEGLIRTVNDWLKPLKESQA